MWLDDDRVAGRQAREHARICVPGREGVAADHQADAPRHDAETLFHPERLVLALRLLPERARRNAPHFIVGVGDRFQRAILSMRTTGLERHYERLPTGVHHRIRHLEAALVDARENFQRYPDPRFRARLAPGHFSFGDCREQRVEIDARIGDAELETVRRCFRAHLADGAWQRHRKWLTEKCVECGLAESGHLFPVSLRTLGERAPVAALCDCLQGAVEKRSMALKQWLRHGLPPIVNLTLVQLV